MLNTGTSINHLIYTLVGLRYQSYFGGIGLICSVNTSCIINHQGCIPDGACTWLARINNLSPLRVNSVLHALVKTTKVNLEQNSALPSQWGTYGVPHVNLQYCLNIKEISATIVWYWPKIWLISVNYCLMYEVRPMGISHDIRPYHFDINPISEGYTWHAIVNLAEFQPRLLH